MMEKVYPDWVQEQKTKGTTIKKSVIIITSINIPQNGYRERKILSR